MSKNIEADGEADRKVIQTRNYSGRQFNLSSGKTEPPYFGERHKSVSMVLYVQKVKFIKPIFVRPLVFCHYVFVYKTGSTFFFLAIKVV